MNKTYNVEILKQLDSLQQIYKSMQFTSSDVASLIAIKDKETYDCQDVHEKAEYVYEHFDEKYGRHIENMHLYNGFAFAKRGLDKQARPEFMITGDPVPGTEMTILNYSQYGLQDYVNLVSRLKDSVNLRIPEKAYRDLIYRQFLSFVLYDRANPFESLEDFFETAIAGILSTVTVVDETDDLWCFKTYSPVLKESVFTKMMNHMKSTYGRGRWGLREQYLKIKNFDHYKISYVASEKNAETRKFTADTVKDAEIWGYYQGYFATEYITPCQQPKKEDAFFEDVFNSNAIAHIMNQYVEQTKLHLVTC